MIDDDAWNIKIDTERVCITSPAHLRTDNENIAQKQYYNSHPEECIRNAVPKLTKMPWFAILELIPDSIDMFLEIFRIKASQLKPLTKRNASKAQSSKWSTETEQYLASLLPMDMYVYDAAVLYFNARLIYHKTGEYRAPTLPPIPSISCTIEDESCDDEPLKTLLLARQVLDTTPPSNNVNEEPSPLSNNNMNERQTMLEKMKNQFGDDN